VEKIIIEIMSRQLHLNLQEVWWSTSVEKCRCEVHGLVVMKSKTTAIAGSADKYSVVECKQSFQY
jgi:hypothetical protein